MKYLKLLLKVFFGIIGLFIILIIVLLSSESYQTTTTKNGNEIIQIEIKRVFGRKISESSINSEWFYHGPSKSWSIFKGALKSEGFFNNGYWHGRWKEYGRDGQLTIIREWDMGRLAKVFIPVGETLKELPKKEWPEYVDVKQGKPQRAH